jgi:hypothetical protein
MPVDGDFALVFGLRKTDPGKCEEQARGDKVKVPFHIDLSVDVDFRW